MPQATRLVVLDGHTLNPGDLSWQPLERLAECIVFPRTGHDPETIGERAADAPLVLTNKTVLDAETLERLPSLVYIGVLATGYNVVDLDAANHRGIVVTNVPAYSTTSVAQMVFAHILNLTQRVADHAAGVRHGRWSESDDFCYWDHPLRDLAGLTLGIVGFGRIGQAVAQRAHAFDMEVLAHDPTPPEDATVRFVELDDLFRHSDIVTLHCPLTDENRYLVNSRRLAVMKPDALLINTARGPLVDGKALAAALDEGTIAGAGLDVLEQEPPPADHPLYECTNCFITPHIAWATRAARSRLLDIAAANIRAFLAGTPQNVVNRPTPS